MLNSTQRDTSFVAAVKNHYINNKAKSRLDGNF